MDNFSVGQRSPTVGTQVSNRIGQGLLGKVGEKLGKMLASCAKTGDAFGTIFEKKEDETYGKLHAGADKRIWALKREAVVTTVDNRKVTANPTEHIVYTNKTVVGIRIGNFVLGVDSKSKVKEESITTGNVNTKVTRALGRAPTNLSCNWQVLATGGVKNRVNILANRASGDFEHAMNPPSKAKPGEEPTTPLDMGERTGFVRDMLNGMLELHKGGFVHGDLKPENCLVYGERGSQHLEIADFGRTQEVGVGESKIYKGNTRFAPPEGVSSQKGEVYSSAMMMMRAFEEQLLDIGTNPIVNVVDKDCTAHPGRRGLDKFVLEDKAFPCYENKGSGIGRLINAHRRNTQMGKNQEAQAAKMKEYADKLCTRLQNQGHLDSIQAPQLKVLLESMLDANPDNRPTAEDALARYNAIFPPT